ncbi:hypothetical protein KSS87_020685 [Heliosperma pusillum]|nr:hypothetical protein KSS87_020685 [Heliosperma pusillum]
MVKGRQGERVRLYVRGSILGYKRSKSNQYPNTSLIQIEGVNTQEEVAWYLGKKMAYIYKAKTKKNDSYYRCIWGKVCRPHGNSGVVRAQFKSNLPPKVTRSESLCIPATFKPCIADIVQSLKIGVSLRRCIDGLGLLYSEAVTAIDRSPSVAQFAQMGNFELLQMSQLIDSNNMQTYSLPPD